eukprot:g430.t1
MFCGCLMIAYLFRRVRSAMRKNNGKMQSMEMDLLKILLNSSYCLGILTSYPITFPGILSPLLQVGQSISSLQSDALSAECLLSNDFDGSKYLMKNALALILPIGGIAFSGAIWMCRYGCLRARLSWARHDHVGRRGRRRSQIPAKDPTQLRRFAALNFAVTVILILFITLPSLTRTATSMIVCTNFGYRGVGVRLRDDPEVLCWRKEHLAYFYGAALPAILVYTVGAPVLGIITLRRHARKGRLWKSAAEDPTANILLFVYSGYEEDRYYWEFVVFARKLALSLVMVASADGQTSGLLGLFILQTASVLQMRSKPYRHRIVNMAESAALLVTSVVIYVGLFFYLSESRHNLTLVVLIFAVVLFTGLYLCLLVSVILHNRCPSVGKRCPKLKEIIEDGEDSSEIELQTATWISTPSQEGSRHVNTWHQRYSEEHEAAYFENTETGETSWDLPADATVVDDGKFSVTNPSMQVRGTSRSNS